MSYVVKGKGLKGLDHRFLSEFSKAWWNVEKPWTVQDRR